MPPERRGRPHARVTRIAVHLPEGRLTNAALNAEHPDWDIARVAAKTGVFARAVAPADTTSGDLAVAAARTLQALDPTALQRVDFLLLCTQTPDFILPTTACILQDRLGLPTSIGALDVNLGCSGFVYGASLAKGLVETGQARAVLLLTAETYTHIIHPDDRSVRTLFGDGAAATLIEAGDQEPCGGIEGFVFGTDGRGAEDLIVRSGGFRNPDKRGRLETDFLQMNGQAVFTFTSKVVPQAVRESLARAEIGAEDISLFVFHQASRLVIDALRRALQIPSEKCWFGIEQIGNTVSATIPIALAQAAAAGRLRPGDKVLVAGFGVGLSWAACVITWDAEFAGAGVV